MLKLDEIRKKGLSDKTLRTQKGVMRSRDKIKGWAKDRKKRSVNRKEL